MTADFYSTLGVKRDASEKDIRSAYRRLARQHHPDVNPGKPEAEERFKAVNAAYEVLSDPAKRQKYDQYGDQWQHAEEIEAMRRQRAGAAYGHGGPRGPGGASFSFDGDLSDLFSGRGGAAAGAGMFDSLFRRGGGQQRGQDIEHGVRLTLEEVYAGTTRTVELRGPGELCATCGGAGQLAGATCHACRGTGSMGGTRRVEVRIPAGVADGARIRVAGKGSPGAGGGAPGDLFLRVQVSAHPVFERRGDDVHVTVNVPVADAALGGEVRVPTLKGRALALRVPAGTQSGRVLRLAGRGMPRATGGFGDLFASVRLVLPDPMSDEQRVLFEQLRATTSGDAMSEADARETSAPASDGAS
ncbi:MAG: J domain-containing protein [Chloroflexi bacterium]|nr:MAG: J domain-containing protein [Chloroflexota bacterium]